jgi:hypothetical protein
VTDPEEVDLKNTDQILVTVSDRAGQTFKPDMEESGAKKKKELAYLPVLGIMAINTTSKVITLIW